MKSVDGGVVVELRFGGVGFHAVLLAHRLGLVEVVDAQAREDEVTTFLGEVERNALSDTRAAAGDECRFVFEV